jgi:hypothetical protein
MWAELANLSAELTELSASVASYVMHLLAGATSDGGDCRASNRKHPSNQ